MLCKHSLIYFHTTYYTFQVMKMVLKGETFMTNYILFLFLGKFSTSVTL
ncbi:hypothetical protein AB205_0110840 [Aquarana catesbeiana]|uniref:Uncharacterized protein n=1 Tax=Aquarana catesbeiana TaxID=8400 RepID=A0A2G9RWM2_AQUCT|nr:hypothetical protein AB205_0110840 [Aquarana catesbeiana]